MPTAQDRTLIEAHGLEPDSLEANRAGLLTTAQARRLRSQRHRWGWMLVAIAAVCIAVGLSDLLPGCSDAAQGDRFMAVASVLFGVGLLAPRFSNFGRSYAAELAAGRVDSVEGFVRVSTRSGDDHTSYHLHIAGREFNTTEAGAKAIDARVRYRVYRLPDSDIMVNIEALDAALDGGTVEDPLFSAQEIAAIVGEPMRCESAAANVGSGAWPGMVDAAFASASSDLHISVRYLLGAHDSALVSFYRRLLTRGPGARAVPGLGDEATYCLGQLLVRQGASFVSVNLLSLQNPESVFAAERSFVIARRVAELALQKLKLR
jgi:hypothetical protein